jgi:hypothetical protein
MRTAARPRAELGYDACLRLCRRSGLQPGAGCDAAPFKELRQAGLVVAQQGPVFFVRDPSRPTSAGTDSERLAAAEAKLRDLRGRSTPLEAGNTELRALLTGPGTGTEQLDSLVSAAEQVTRQKQAGRRAQGRRRAERATPSPMGTTRTRRAIRRKPALNGSRRQDMLTSARTPLSIASGAPG